ncbi:TonB family protein [Qipengyuania marisflavi]|uniref:Protein TonB n=1 Tax=Qipengyuania marisflavi TaxID=2486356 RepID=A0A5S3P798_9SPHN|nr:TonB family protein [Qipengyuania marisflavi]TMM48103.1 TonB family protein [Qipengyuania marisflavi]
MAYADQQMSGNRIVAIIIVALIHIALGYALITGLAYEAASKLVERVTTIDVEEPPPPEEPDEPPPPPEPDAAPPPPVAPPPPIRIAPAPPPIRTQVTIPPPAPIQRIVPPKPAPPAPAPAPPAPPAPSKARAASPKGQEGWAARIRDNYPRRAERDGTEGSVGVSITIGPDGRVSNCSVSSSSGSSELDSAACQGMTRYARYNPALNAAGDPIPGSASTTIVYKLN